MFIPLDNAVEVVAAQGPVGTGSDCGTILALLLTSIFIRVFLVPGLLELVGGLDTMAVQTVAAWREKDVAATASALVVALAGGRSRARRRRGRGLHVTSKGQHRHALADLWNPVLFERLAAIRAGGSGRLGPGRAGLGVQGATAPLVVEGGRRRLSETSGGGGLARVGVSDGLHPSICTGSRQRRLGGVQLQVAVDVSGLSGHGGKLLVLDALLADRRNSHAGRTRG